MTAQPYRVLVELPDGNGVWLEPVCVLCDDATTLVQCPICDRLFCAALCYGVHLTARDTLDASDRIDAFLHTEAAHELLDAVVQGASMGDWRHALTCDDCRPELREAVVRILATGVEVIAERHG